MPSEPDRFRGCLLGLAVGDAVGTTLEFRSRGSFEPITDMEGGGPFHLRAGEWTDDTSMALCLATSLVECGGFDARDQMERYCRWAEEGYLSSNGRCFDIGTTVSAALHRYRMTGDPYSGDVSPARAGNGSLMRLAPIVLFFHPDRAEARHFAGESSRTTHAAAECLDACRVLAELLSKALAGQEKQAILFENPPVTETTRILAIASGGYRHKTREQIRGSGYVVECLESALWCFERTNSFREAVLEAANLGDDADTTAAVCGQIAGAYYGAEGIPKKWLKRLVMTHEITQLADSLHGRPR